jgi:cell wall-associated NlpC family hydrolase
VASGPWRRGLTGALIAVVLGLVPHAAGATALSDKQAQARRLEAQIETLGNKEAALAEQYNGARLASQAADAKVSEATSRLTRARAQVARARSLVRQVAVSSYVKGPGVASVNSRTTGFEPQVAQFYVVSVTSHGADALDQERAATLRLSEEQAALAAAQRGASNALAGVDAGRKDVARTEGALRAKLAQVNGDLGALVAQAAADRQAADAARALLARQAAAQQAATQQAAALAQAPIARPAAPGARRDLSVGPPAAVPARAPTAGAGPAPKAGAQAAVAEALRQVGKPYQWGAAGPDSFDCSGLTLWAWRAGGVSLPHYTGAQYSATPHVALSGLQPGDLVYSADMGHMAMYIGNGNMVEAPHTGANVRVVPLRSDLVLASRP